MLNSSAHHVDIIRYRTLIYIVFLICLSLYTLWTQPLTIMEMALITFSTLGCIILAQAWSSWQYFSLAVILMTHTAVWLYQGDLQHGQPLFLLKYFLSSQSAILWMCVLYLLATLIALAGNLRHTDQLLKLSTQLTWIASAAGLTGLAVRWHESLLINPDYLPLSTLYEVLVLFCPVTALIYLYQTRRTPLRQFNSYILLLISGVVLFLLWYATSRQAHTLTPMLPALRSWWLILHVPTSFIGYGGFCVAAMLSLARLIMGRKKQPDPAHDTLLPTLDEHIYACTVTGYLFFTLSILTGALWADQAWGSYWRWDPKETWALIVWLNYTAWLHARQIKHWQGKKLAIWSIIGLLLTAFAFLGVNLWLPGLHAYGSL